MRLQSLKVSCHGYIAVPLSSAILSRACSSICDLFLRRKNPHCEGERRGGRGREGEGRGRGEGEGGGGGGEGREREG